MDARFKRVWNGFDRRRDAGETLPEILRKATAQELVAALASAPPPGDAVAANAIATELLNRLRVARILGFAFLLPVFAVAVILADAYITGAWGVLDSGAITIAVAASAVGIAAILAVRIMVRLRLERKPGL